MVQKYYSITCSAFFGSTKCACVFIKIRCCRTLASPFNNFERYFFFFSLFRLMFDFSRNINFSPFPLVKFSSNSETLNLSVCSFAESSQLINWFVGFYCCSSFDPIKKKTGQNYVECQLKEQMTRCRGRTHGANIIAITHTHKHTQNLFSIYLIH